MAKAKSTKKRVIKKSETVRERATKITAERPKRRVIKSTAGKVAKPLSALKPLAKPFKAKPVKKVSRGIAFILWPKFLRGAWGELRQVTWPGRRETWKLTLAVFIFALSFGSLIALADYGLDKLFRSVILK